MIYLNDQLDAFDFASALPLLSAQRREQALKFRHPFGRKACAAAYLLLCDGLRQEYGLTEKPLFGYGEHGKPFIVGHPEIHFNLSHCREAVLCVLSDRPVGADVESVREYRESLVRYTMSDEEMADISGSPSPALTFTRYWTMKEAALKLTGEGLRSDMRGVLAGFRHQMVTRVNEARGYVYSIAGWTA